MKKFYKFYAESREGEIGDYLVEVIDNLVTRQIFVFGNRLLWADESGEADVRYGLTDQPEWKKSDEEEGANHGAAVRATLGK